MRPENDTQHQPESYNPKPGAHRHNISGVAKDSTSSRMLPARDPTVQAAYYCLGHVRQNSPTCDRPVGFVSESTLTARDDAAFRDFVHRLPTLMLLHHAISQLGRRSWLLERDE